MSQETPATASVAPVTPKRSWKKMILLVLLAMLLVGGVVVVGIIRYPDQAQDGKGEDISVEIPKGVGPQELASVLSRAGVVDDADAFAYFVRLSGRLKDIKAGAHLLRDNQTPRELLDLLCKPPQAVQVSVTIAEGKSIREMAPLFEQAGVCSAELFIKTAKDPSFAKELGLKAKSLEGYLFPDTYRFKPNTDPKTVLRAMKKRFDGVFVEVKEKYAKDVELLKRDLLFGDEEIVIFASLIEKETGKPEERRFIASVFLNRLLDPAFKPKYLATDPTIIYGLAESPKGFDGDIRYADLRDESNPYNTYVHEGLPPGPITNFGREALAAALAPAPSRCYFFVARGDESNSSFFSEKEELHRKAVDIYQKRMAGATATSLKNAPDCTKQQPTYTRKPAKVSP